MIKTRYKFAINSLYKVNLYSMAHSAHRKLVGIKNTGNTCYINSVFQLLSYAPGFVKNLQEGIHHAQRCDGKRQDTAPPERLFVNHLLSLWDKSFDGSRHTCLRNIFKLVLPSGQDVHTQQSASEVLMNVLNALHGELQITAEFTLQTNGPSVYQGTTPTYQTQVQQLKQDSKQLTEQEFQENVAANFEVYMNTQITPQRIHHDLMQTLNKFGDSYIAASMRCGLYESSYRMCQACGKQSDNNLFVASLMLTTCLQKLETPVDIIPAISAKLKATDVNIPCSNPTCHADTTLHRCTTITTLPQILFVDVNAHVTITLPDEDEEFDFAAVYKGPRNVSLKYKVWGFIGRYGQDDTSGHFVTWIRCKDAKWKWIQFDDAAVTKKRSTIGSAYKPHVIGLYRV